MQQITEVVAGAQCLTLAPDRPDEMARFDAFLSRSEGAPLAVDTETTGLDIFRADHGVRLVQFGTATEAWALRVDLFRADIARVLSRGSHFLMHNATYDMLVSDRHGLADLETLAPKVTDTRILAHLIDPRRRPEGGTGHKLKELAAVYVDPDAQDGEAALKREFRRLKMTEAEGWRHIPIDNDVYVRYAGLDVLLTWRLWAELAPRVTGVGLGDLARFEHHLQGLLAILERRGVRIDVPYTERLRDALTAEATEFAAVAARYGVESVNSPKQVAAALGGMGETLTDRTAGGALSVGKEVLLALADLDREWTRIGAREPNLLADAVVRSKRAGKWASTYAQAFLDLMDPATRLHPKINGLQARTARMSIAHPPLQQLPSSDWRVRRSLIPDPGMTMVAADYSQVEMRVLAALAQEPTMMAAIASGTDLHDFTAKRVYGDDFTKAQRKVSKAIGFGKVYGGGASSIAQQTGASLAGVKEAIAAYDATFPGVRRYAAYLQRRARYGAVEVVTPSGRHLPLDRQRLYAATNYVVQSTARDILAQALVDLFDQGLGDFLLLPVHDEVLAQAPDADAAEVVAEIGRVMESTFYGVAIKSDTTILGPSWGHGYGAKE